MRNFLKYLFTFLLLGATKTAYVQPLGNSNDTICLPISDALKVLEQGLKGKVFEQKIIQYQKDSSILSKRLTQKDNIITSMRTKSILDAAAIKSYEKEIKVMNDRDKFYDNQISGLNKQVKQEKLKRTFTTIGGVLAAFVALWFGLTH